MNAHERAYLAKFGKGKIRQSNNVWGNLCKSWHILLQDFDLVACKPT
jgi:hypothetical protein